MKSYANNRLHYKMLISKINAEVNFENHLLQQGYKLIKASAGSKEFKKEMDSIVLNTKRNPTSYFNRNDSEDKGRFFGFINNRCTNFYEAIRLGLEAINSSHLLLEPQKRVLTTKPNKPNPAKFSIEALTNTEYLTKFRGLSKHTLTSKVFKGRCFNAYYRNANGGKIANVALPKYQVDGTIENYTIYNKPYWCKETNKSKKFRRVFNSNYHFLFTSNPEIRHDGIGCFESAFDAMAYYEIKEESDLFYISFAGQLDEKKMGQFFLWRDKVDPHCSLPITLAFDSDSAGLYYDLYLVVALMVREIESPKPELQKKGNLLKLWLHYPIVKNETLQRHYEGFSHELKKLYPGDSIVPIQIICFRNKLLFTIKMDSSLAWRGHEKGEGMHWGEFIQLIAKKLLKTEFKIAKPQLHKDWNEALIWAKNYKAIQNLDQMGEKVSKNTWAVVSNLRNKKNCPFLARIIKIQKENVLCDIGQEHYVLIKKDTILQYFIERRETQQKNRKQIKTHARKK